MSITIKNSNTNGRFSMALKIGETEPPTYILPGEEVLIEELQPVLDVATESKMKILAERKNQEMKEKADARKKERELKQSTGPEYVWDAWSRKPCCVCPPCALCGPCIDDLVNPDNPVGALLCFPFKMLCGKLTDPVCIGHCKCFEICDFCVNCRCSCCPPQCTCCNITCPPNFCFNCPSCWWCLPKCLGCCPPKCSWCGITCPPACPAIPQCCLDCLPKCLQCCPPKCSWCGIQCPPQCCLDLCAYKPVGCNCVFCHFTCTTYLKCCPTCLFCVEEAIKMNENKLIVKKDVELNVNQGAAPHSAEMAR